mgnify:CR=1 FL=1
MQQQHSSHERVGSWRGGRDPPFEGFSAALTSCLTLLCLFTCHQHDNATFARLKSPQLLHSDFTLDFVLMQLLLCPLRRQLVYEGQRRHWVQLVLQD